MLRPRSDRIDYGEKLCPPHGYTLSYAVATSFTLELETLICLPIALSFDNSLEGKLEGEKLALLEAISQLNGKLKVFFQQGKIKIPHQFNRLFTLLEPCLAPVAPSSAFSSFHPKLWLLRFIGPSNAVHYRLIVLSRNLTFDRSWDLAVTLEGVRGEQTTHENDGLLQLLVELKTSAPDFSAAFSIFKKELPRVVWNKPSGFHSLKTLAGGSESVPLDFGGDTAKVLVMSPFLDPKALDWIRQRGKEHWLLSRGEELDRVGEEPLSAWRCYALNDRIVGGEDDLESAQAQQLHAKFLALQNGATTHWHLGSANATQAALGDGIAAPRNTEFMVRLTGRGSDVSIDRILEELVGTDDKPSGIFVRHQFTEQVEPEQPLSDADLRKLEHALANAAWTISTTTSDDGTYRCEVTSDTQFKMPALCVVEVGLLATDSYQPFAPAMEWIGLGLSQISAFLPFRVFAEGEAKPLFQLMVKARLIMPEGADRAQKIMSELIDSPEKLLAYVRLLLLPDPEKTEWFGVDLGDHNKQSNNPMEKLLEGPIFESLLKSAARQPDHLLRIERLLDSLKAAKVPVPHEFSQLWECFREHSIRKR